MRALLIGLVKAYRLLLSPWLGSSCRFEPTCSLYAIGALQQHGALAGGSPARGGRAGGPPGWDGGCARVPEHPPRPFTRLVDPERPNSPTPRQPS